MEWTHEMVLEFLRLFALEPVIWNPKHDENRKKNSVSDAWLRIQSGLSWKCKVEDLKRKKDSLMAYYRIHTRKIKKAKCSDSNESEFRTSWFAFEAMHSFLGDVYNCPGVIGSEENDEGSHSSTMELNECMSNDSHSQPKTSDRPDQIDVMLPQNTIDNSMTTQERTGRNETLTECEMYAQLLARKLAKLDEDDRLTLMNNIDNVVFQATMRAKRKRKHESPANAELLYSPCDGSDDTQPSSSRRPGRDPLVASPYRISHRVQSPDASRTDYILPSATLPHYKSPTISLLSKNKSQPRTINIKKEMEKDDHDVIVETYDTIQSDED